MADDERSKLPATTKDARTLGAHQKSRSEVARGVRNPLAGFFFGLGSRANTKSVELDTKEKIAAKGNLEAQGEVIKAMMGLQDIVMEYDARQTYAPELQAEADAKVRDSLGESEYRRDVVNREREAEKEEWETQTAIRKARLEAELAQAQHAKNAAQHGVDNFAASTQARINQTKHVWEGKALDAEAERNEQEAIAKGVRGQIASHDPKQAYLQKLRDDIENAAAIGEHDIAERIRAAIALIEET